MKLATLRDGSRDGRLVVVDRDLTRCVAAPSIAPTLQAALDDWEALGPRLASVADTLQSGGVDSQAFDPAACESPLPRAYQWADGSAYVNHVELVRKARGAEMPESFWADPLMYQGGSDRFLGPRDAIVMADAGWGIDFEAEVAVITGDVPAGASVEEAKAAIRLVMLVNDVSLRNLVPGELAKGFGFFQSKPPTAFSPVAVSPDDLGPAWDGGKISLPLISTLNGTEFGRPNAGQDMTFDFPALIAHAAKTRPLMAGTIIGSGTVSNTDRSAGSSCIAERRMLETIEGGEAKTLFLQEGDVIRIEMLDNDDKSIFGAIENTVHIRAQMTFGGAGAP